MPVTTICGIIGALAISSFPFTSGFISKSMISQAAADQGFALAWFLLAAASAGVFLHAGIKFPWFVFFQKDSGLRPPDPPWNMRLSMYIFSFFCIGLGLWPQTLYVLLPFPVSYEPYTVSHVVTMLQLLLFSGLAFFLLLPQMKRTLTITLDFDWFYRKLGTLVAREFTSKGSLAHQHLEKKVKRETGRLLDSLIRQHGPYGFLGRTWPTGSMALWAVGLLGFILLSYYLQ